MAMHDRVDKENAVNMYVWTYPTETNLHKKGWCTSTSPIILMNLENISERNWGKMIIYRMMDPLAWYGHKMQLSWHWTGIWTDPGWSWGGEGTAERELCDYKCACAVTGFECLKEFFGSELTDSANIPHTSQRAEVCGLGALPGFKARPDTLLLPSTKPQRLYVKISETQEVRVHLTHMAFSKVGRLGGVGMLLPELSLMHWGAIF